MGSRINPLTWTTPIVDEQGKPTREFQIKWDQLNKAAGTIPSLNTPEAVSAVLDILSGGAVNGSILVRESGQWKGKPSPSDATMFLSGANPPAYAHVTDIDLSLSDVITNNASTTKHGFVPKLPNDATKYYDGTGNFSVPAGGGGGGGNVERLFAITTSPIAIGAGVTTETTLASYVMPAGKMANDGDMLRIVAVFEIPVGTGATRTGRAKFGGATGRGLGISSAAQVFELEQWVLRTGVTSQVYYSKVTPRATTFGGAAAVFNTSFALGAIEALTEDLAAAVTIAFTGQTTTAGANAINLRLAFVDYFPV